MKKKKKHEMNSKAFFKYMGCNLKMIVDSQKSLSALNFL